MPRKSASRRNAAKKALKMHAVIETRKRAQQMEGNDNSDLTTSAHKTIEDSIFIEVFDATVLVANENQDKAHSNQINKHNQDTEEWIPVNKSESPIPDTSTEPSPSEGDHSNNSGLKRKRICVEVPVKQTRAEIQEQKTITQALKEIQSHLHVLVSHNVDYHDTFGKYVASLLRTLPPQKALDLQPRIVALITKYGIQNLDTEDPLESQDDTEELIIKMEDDSE